MDGTAGYVERYQFSPSLKSDSLLSVGDVVPGMGLERQSLDEVIFVSSDLDNPN